MFSLIKQVQAIKPILSSRIAASFQTSAFEHGKYDQLEAKLGLPPRPKRPLSPYFRFLNENRLQVTKENPKLKNIDVIKLCAQKYRDDLDGVTKERYFKEFAKEQEDYARKRFQYLEKLTQDQKLSLAEAKDAIVDRRERIAYKKKLRDNNKPKRPPTGFIRYLMEAATKHPRDQSKQSYREWQKVTAEKWNALSEDQKKVYNDAAKVEFVKHKEELLKWEHKMVRAGNTDIIRDVMAIDRSTEKPKRRPNRKPAASSSDSD